MTTGPTTAQRRAWGRIGALKLHGTGKTNTAPARAALAEKWMRMADPAGVLSPDERARRGDMLRRAHLLEASMKGVEARRRKAA